MHTHKSSNCSAASNESIQITFVAEDILMLI